MDHLQTGFPPRNDSHESQSNVQLIECSTYRDVQKLGSKFQRIGSLGLFDEFLVEPQQFNE